MSKIRLLLAPILVLGLCATTVAAFPGDQAEASLDAAQEQLRYQNLLLEQRTAHAYHALQLATARRYKPWPACSAADRRIARASSGATVTGFAFGESGLAS